MKRILTVLALVACAGTPVAAQWAGIPVWNNPKGGTGVTISADLGLPNSDYGKGTAYGARATLGLANLSLTAGLVNWKPDGFTDSHTSIGGNAAFRIIGGSLLPVSLNLQFGAASVGEADATPKSTRITAGGGIAVNVPTPGLNIEPYLSVTNRWTNFSGTGFNTESNIGWTLGANVGFGMLGVHVAYDSENASGGSVGVIGIGAHVALKAPIGM